MLVYPIPWLRRGGEDEHESWREQGTGDADAFKILSPCTVAITTTTTTMTILTYHI